VKRILLALAVTGGLLLTPAAQPARRAASTLRLTLLSGPPAQTVAGEPWQLRASLPRPLPKLRIPYDVELDAAGRVWITDGGRHQILRYVPRTRKVSIVARTTRFDEIVDLVFDRSGNAYVSDVSQGRVRKIDRTGAVTTVAELEAPAALSVDPTGRYLAISSLAGTVRRLTLDTGQLETLVATGLSGPHGLAYDRDGNLLIADPPDRVLKFAAPTQALELVARTSIYRVAFAPDGALYGIGGGPTGGHVKRISEDGRTTNVVGTGRLGPYRDHVRATRAGISPMAIAFASRRVLYVAQTRPAPAIRRVDLTTGIITTLYR
jgi:streptogramin lyase